MWEKIVIQEKPFLIRTTLKDNACEIMLSEFSKVWSESLTEEEMLRRCKELNTLYEAEPDILIKRILELLNPRQSNIKKEILEVGNQLTVMFSSYLSGFVFKFNFILSLTTPEKFCKSLTIPLIQIIEELQSRQKALCDLLVKKDIEINEYKMEGAQLSRKNIITKPFKEEEFVGSEGNSREERSLSNLKCPFTFFEKSCAVIYEECVKREKVTEVLLSPQKERHETHMNEDPVTKPETSRRRKGNEIIYDDGEDDDETHFPTGDMEIKPMIKVEVKNLLTKKKKRLNL